MEQATTFQTESNDRPIKQVRPFGLLISTIQNIGGKRANENKHRRAFFRLMKDNAYEDYMLAVVDEWLRLKYASALAAAFPPTKAEIKARRQAKLKKDREARTRSKVFKFKLVGAVLDAVMPNGKTLAKCTGAECIHMGGWLAKIGKVVGPQQIVGEVLTEVEILKLTR